MVVLSVYMSDGDLQAMAIVGDVRTKKWTSIAKKVGSRNATQCRERWCNVLDPDLKTGDPFRLPTWASTMLLCLPGSYGPQGKLATCSLQDI